MSTLPSAYQHLKLKVFDDSYQYVLFPNSDVLWECASELRKNGQPVFLFDTEGDKSLITLDSVRTFGHVKTQRGWKAVRVVGEMPFGTVRGLLATLSQSLKERGIGVCVVSTFLTDFFFIVEKNFDRAAAALEQDGWSFAKEPIRRD